MIDPDQILRDEPGHTRISAGRAAIDRANANLEHGRTFAIETTLAGNRTLRLMDDAAARGYRVTLVFVGTENVDINLRRIRDRVALGGHDVPETDVRRRYVRGLERLPAALTRAHDASLLDNSDVNGFKEIVVSRDRQLHAKRTLPKWAATVTAGSVTLRTHISR